MAKQKKQEEQAPGSPAWMATFSDLMNLLLCFFVLLFSMSSVDQEKWEQLVNSLASRISIFNGGMSSIGEGQLISSGISQLNELDEFFDSMGQSAEDTGDELVENTQESIQETIDNMNREETEEIYDNVSSMSTEYNLDKYVEIGMDPGGRYITIEISGNWLYASGSATLTSDAQLIFSKIGDILKNYKGYRIAIIGHTDNVPVGSGSRYASNMELSSARASEAARFLINNKGLDAGFLEWVGRGEYDPIADNSTESGRAQNRRIEIRVYNSLNSD